MFVKDLEGRYSLVNKEFQKRFGLTERQVIGKTDDEIFSPEQAAEFRASDRQVRDAGVSIETEDTAQYVDGPHVSIVSRFPIPDRKGGIAAIGGVATDITERRRVRQERERHAEQLRSLSRRLVELQETYRRELSRELHDRVGQNLTALNINLEIALNELPQGFKRKHAPRLKDSLALVKAMTESVEDVMSELRPPMLDDYGLLPALRALVKAFAKRTAIPAEVKGGERLDRIDPATEIALYRIAQEALTNVAKHARAGRVEIVVSEEPGGISLTIMDNGIGFDPSAVLRRNPNSGWGMLNMRERAEAAGGTFKVESAPGKGTRVKVTVAR
jgi:PAS domain S-box-containing protein